MKWLHLAACKGTVKPEVFFEPDQTRVALAICHACEAMILCRHWFDQVETVETTHGIVGGETETTRLRRRAQRRAA